MTDTVPLDVKWNKDAFSINFVVAGGVKGLKKELEEKTGVPADRMKLMAKSKGLWKGVLKDDFDLSSIDFAGARQKAGGKDLQILLMGSAAKLDGPKTKTVFLEDLPPEEIAKVKEPSGLANLGNTCYMNSVVQCLRAVPPFRKGITTYTPSTTNQQNGAYGPFLSALRDTFNILDRTADAVNPSALVRATKMAFPQFAQRGPQGQPMQQDAEEFYSGLLTIMASETKGKDKIARGLDITRDEELKGADNMIDALFGLKMEETLTCDEFDADDSKMEVEGEGAASAAAAASAVEPAVKSFDLHRKLVCNIQGGADGASQTNVSHINEGIALSLNGKIEKRSEVLGRDAVWTRKQRIARLPPIICVQFGRFYWKPTPDSQDHAGVKCKVMKPVAFNSILDVYEFCTDEVQKILKVSRDKALAEEEERINNRLNNKGETKDEEMKDSEDAKAGEDSKVSATKTEGEEEEVDAELKAALAMSMEEPLSPVGPGLPDNFQGQYELFGVVTHKGRDADGGHYMGWVKADSNAGKVVEKIAETNEDNEDWFVFDDDEVSPCKTEDVLKLKGGGDWHMSYLNFYRAKK